MTNVNALFPGRTTDVYCTVVFAFDFQTLPSSSLSVSGKHSPKSSAYEDAKYNAAFDRCVDVMTRLIEKYGHQVLEKLDQEASQAMGHSQDDAQAKPLKGEAA